MNEFENLVKVLVNAPDKFAIAQSLLRFPIETIPLTDKIFDGLLKVYDGQNPVRKCEFVVPDAEIDYEDYRRDQEIEAKLKKQTIQVVKNQINAIRIVDLPEVQTGVLPEPYFYILDIGCVIDYEVEDENFVWIIFRQSPTQIAVIDDTSYRVFQTKERLNELVEGSVPKEAPHDLTYCPASWAWSDSISESEPDLKLAPITTHIEPLNWLLIAMIGKKHHELYGSWNVTWAYDSECDYGCEVDGYGWSTCDAGKLKSPKGYIPTGGGVYMPCPKCGSKPLAGAGAHIRVPIPRDGTDMREPVGFIAPSKELLDFHVEDVDRLSKHIYEDIVGYGGEMPNGQAVNEKQILAAFERWTSNLRQLKPNIERANEWTEYTICKLRYADKFNDCSHDLGTDFYLLDAGTILSIYNDLRTKGADQNILSALYDKYLMAEYRNSPDSLAYQRIRVALNPFPHLDLNQVNDLWTKNIIDEKEYQLYIKFDTFVKRFEREQASLLVFGSNLTFDKKIDSILKILLSYGRAIDPTTNQGAQTNQGKVYA